MEQIQFKGLKELEDVDQEMVKKLAEEYYGKIKRELHNELTLVIHIKTSSKEGHRHRYEVKVRAECPSKIFESHAEEWDLATGIHGPLKDLKTQVQHTFHD